MDRPITDQSWIKKRYRKYLVFGIIALFALIIFLFAGNSKSVIIERERVTIDTVSLGWFNDYIQITGTAEPIHTVFLDAVEGGRVEKKYFEEGSLVKKGDVILKLSNNDLILSILTSESMLAEKSNLLRETQILMEQQKLTIEREMITTRYAMESKRRIYNQNKELYDDKLISKEEFVTSRENFQIAFQTFDLMKQRLHQDSLFRRLQMNQLSGDLHTMQQNLAIVKEQSGYLEIKAPIDGQIGMLDAGIGQSVKKGQRVGQINDLSSFKIEAEVDEHYIDRVRQGLSASINGTNDTLLLHIRKVYPDVREGKFKIDLVFNDSLLSRIRTGQTYYLRLELGQPSRAVLIPRGGFFQSTGGQWIFIVDRSGKYATKRSIRIGRQNPKYYEILEGLHPGERVITSGYDAMGNNENVIFK